MSSSRGSVLAMTLAFAVACGSSAALQLCQDETNAVCERVLTCASPAMQADAGFVALYGSSQSDCVAKVGVKCAGVSDKTPCGGASNQTYDAQAAQQCVTSTQNATCAQIQDPTFRPAGCDQACQ